MTDAAFLARVSLFAQCPPEELSGLASLLQPRQYARGEVVFHQDDPGAAMYIIREGKVAITLGSAEGKEMTLALLGQGDFFGELALLDGEPRAADARAIETSRLDCLRREDFLTFLRAHPHVGPVLLASLSLRLRRTDQIVHDAAFLDVRARLARVLLKLGESEGESRSGSVVIASRLTQSDLASMVGATRESINKYLRLFARDGLLRYHRGQLVLLDQQGLRREAVNG